jgi:flagellar basal-body rod protein FlgC
MSLLGTLPIAGSGMAAEAERLAAVASNLANANSATSSSGQPYRAREVVFQAASVGEDGGSAPARVGMAGVRVAAVVQSAAPLHQVYDPGNRLADANGYVQMPNVDPVEEMINMISAQQDYQADLEAFNVAKTLALRTLSI